MFSDLRNLAVRDKPVMTRQQVSLLRARRLKLLQLAGWNKARTDLVSGRGQMAVLNSDYADLRRLRAVITVYGLNKAMMALVDPSRRGISRVVPNMPSLETLDLIGTSKDDPRTKVAVEGIDDILDLQTDQMAEWIQSQAASICASLCATADQIDDLDDTVASYLQMFENCDVDMSALAEAVVELVPHDCAADRIAALLKVLPEIDAQIPDPTDADAMDTWLAGLKELVETCGEQTGLCVNPTNPHHLQYGDPSSACDRVSGTFEALGYTIENLVDLLKNSDLLLDALEALIARKEDISNQLDAAASMVSAVDNDVPPAVEDAVAAPDADPISGGTVAQTDVVFCHVDSCINCIAAVTDAALRAVQDVLAAADHVDATCSVAQDG